MPGLRIIKVRSGSPVTPGTELILDAEEGVIGRSLEADVRLEDPTIGRAHVRFRVVEGALEVEVLSERATTFVDGAAASGGGSYRLRIPGGRLQLGGVMLEVIGEPQTVEFGHRLEGDTQEAVSPDMLRPPSVHSREPLFAWRWENGEAHIWCAGSPLDLRPSAARALAALLEFPGEPVHQLSIRESVGGDAQVDQLISYARRGLRRMMRSESLPRTRVEATLRSARISADAGKLKRAADTELLRLLIQSRRGYGYILNCPADEVHLMGVELDAG